jgi:hypothetical protein
LPKRLPAQSYTQAGLREGWLRKATALEWEEHEADDGEKREWSFLVSFKKMPFPD